MFRNIGIEACNRDDSEIARVELLKILEKESFDIPEGTTDFDALRMIENIRRDRAFNNEAPEQFCVNRSTLIGDSWSTIPVDDIYVVPSGENNYCFTRHELEQFNGVNPFTREAIPELEELLQTRWPDLLERVENDDEELSIDSQISIGIANAFDGQPSYMSISCSDFKEILSSVDDVKRILRIFMDEVDELFTWPCYAVLLHNADVARLQLQIASDLSRLKDYERNKEHLQIVVYHIMTGEFGEDDGFCKYSQIYSMPTFIYLFESFIDKDYSTGDFTQEKPNGKWSMFNVGFEQYEDGVLIDAQYPISERRGMFSHTGTRDVYWEKIGKWTYYYYGNIEREEEWENGTRLTEKTYAHGVLVTSTDETVKPSVMTTYFATGEIKSTVELGDNGSYNGKYQSYYKDGTTASMGSYTDDVKSGEWEYFAESGYMILTGVYVDDVKSGDWEEFYDDGKVAVGQFDYDEKNGEWIEYNMNGTITKGDYEYGTKVGEWSTYDSEENLISTQVF